MVMDGQDWKRHSVTAKNGNGKGNDMVTRRSRYRNFYCMKIYPRMRSHKCRFYGDLYGASNSSLDFKKNSDIGMSKRIRTKSKF